MADGVKISDGKFDPIEVNAGQTKSLPIDLQKPDIEPGVEYVLLTRFALTEDRSWAKAGHLIATNQFVLPWSKPAEAVARSGKVELKDDEKMFVLSANDRSFGFEKQKMTLASMKRGQEELLVSPLVPNFWRPITDNDRIGGRIMKIGAKRWQDVFDSAELLDYELSEDGSTATVTVQYKLKKVDAMLEATFAVDGAGGLTVTQSISRGKDSPMMPRLGWQFSVSDALSDVAWYGRGPQESYWDRKQGMFLGAYKLDATDMFYSYARPQENGNRSDCRTATFNFGDASLLVKGEPTFDFSVWPYSMDNIQDAGHTNELKSDGTYTVNLDYRQMGVGGDNSWSPKAFPLKKYRLNERKISWDVKLQIE